MNVSIHSNIVYSSENVKNNLNAQNYGIVIINHTTFMLQNTMQPLSIIM